MHFFFFHFLSTDTPLRGIFLIPSASSLSFAVMPLHCFSLHFHQNIFFQFAFFRECCYISVLLLFFFTSFMIFFQSLPYSSQRLIRAICHVSQIFLALFALRLLVVLPYRPSSFVYVLSNVA